MFIRNGALVIFSRDKEERTGRRKISLRIQIFLAILVTGYLPLVLMDNVVTKNALDSFTESRLTELQYQCNTLSKQLTKEGYLLDSNNGIINSELEQLSDVYSGRILVVDNTFRIIRDTYEADTGKYLVSELVINCFKGQTKAAYDYGEAYVRFAMPVYDREQQVTEGVMVVSTSIKEQQALMGGIVSGMRILETIAFIILALVAFLLSGYFIRPFHKVRDAMEAVSIGNLEPVDISDCKETVQISEAYNQTLTQLKVLDQSRQEFVSNVSHELKTPITSIRVLADSLLSMEDVPADLYREFMSDISVEIDRESKIIEDLLTLVRLDKSSGSLNIEQVNLNELIELTLKRLRPIAKKRNIEIVFESYRPVVADIDEVKLTLAISNLVENGIKYNEDGGWVKVTLNADHKFFYIKVQDSGEGISKEAQDHIFERFYRVDKARSRETGGTGLGLAITKNIVQMHQGAIKVYSVPGEGTTFTIRIPLIYIA